jgi:hypothetical protein
MSAASLSDSTSAEKRRHVVRRLAQEGDEGLHRQRDLRQRRRQIVKAAALPGAAVAFEAAVGEVEPLAVDGIASRRRVIGARGDAATGGECPRDRGDGCEAYHGSTDRHHRHPPQR